MYSCNDSCFERVIYNNTDNNELELVNCTKTHRVLMEEGMVYFTNLEISVFSGCTLFSVLEFEQHLNATPKKMTVAVVI